MPPTPAFDGVLLDIDGTLWDSRDAVAEAWAPLLAEAGRPPLTREAFTALFGKTTDAITRALFGALSDAECKRQWRRLWDAERAGLAVRPGRVYPGVREAVAALARHAPVLIASNCEKGYPELAIAGCGIGPFVRDHLCYGDTLAPKAETIRRLVARHGLRAPVYVGDTEADEAACRDAGVPFVHAAYGFGTAHAPFAVVRAPAELPGVLFPA